MAPFVASEFIAKSHSMLIAPAGYGKTHAIAECLKYTHGKSLVLTHTNAGVSALKEKFKAQNIPAMKFHIETITGYAQKYVLSFVNANTIPSQDIPKQYYHFLISTATKIIQNRGVEKIIRGTYQHLFVDEYQDCTLSQHNMVLTLSNCMHTHVLGDPMQGIFNFNPQDPLISMENSERMREFITNSYELTEPWRWNLNGRNELGAQLRALREQLIQQRNGDIYYANYPAIIRHRVADPYTGLTPMVKAILQDHENVLFIHPDTMNKKPRTEFVRLLNNRVFMIESLDDKDFYSLAKAFDKLRAEKLLPQLYDICVQLFGKTHTQEWFTGQAVKNRQKYNKTLSEKLTKIVCSTASNLSHLNMALLLEFFKSELKLPTARVDLLNSLISSLKEAHRNNSTVYEEMCKARNRLRRHGRKIRGHCIGTTLLTKGLECDCVVLLDIDKFPDYKHLYVALTRGGKEVHVIKYDQQGVTK